MSFSAYPVYKGSGVEWLGAIPEGWEPIPFKYVADFINGMAFKPEQWSEAGIPIIRIENLNNGESFNCYEGAVEERYHVKTGDLLFGWSGNRGTSFGPFLWHGIGLHYLNQHIFRIADFRCDKKWLYWTLRAVTKAIEDQAHGIIGMVHVTKGKLGGIKIPLLPRPEQTQIARFLDHETARIDALIEEQQRLIELLKEKRHVVISHAVTKGLDPTVPMKDSGVKWLGDVPAHWEVLATKRFFRMVADPAPNDNDYELLSVYTEIGVRPRKELEQKGNKASTTDGYWRVKRGDLIVNKLLAWMGAVGYSDYDGVTSPAYDILRSSRQLSPKFYHYIFRGKPAQQEFKRWSRGIMEMRLRLYFDELGRISMPFPPLGEQEKIVDFIEAMETKFESLSYEASEQVRLLSERRTALISAAVTGKIDVRDWQPPVSVQAPLLEAEAV